MNRLRGVRACRAGHQPSPRGAHIDCVQALTLYTLHHFFPSPPLPASPRGFLIQFQQIGRWEEPLRTLIPALSELTRHVEFLDPILVVPGESSCCYQESSSVQITLVSFSVSMDHKLLRLRLRLIYIYHLYLD